MTQPSEEEVRAWLESLSRPAILIGVRDVVVDTRHAEACYRAALGLLDAGRKDRERLAVLLAVAEWQIRGDVHELTCGNESRHRPLVPTLDGLRCLDCDWTQDVPAWLDPAAVDQARGA